MGDWTPQPQEWSPDQADKARRIVSSGSFQGDPNKLETLRQAVDYYDRNLEAFEAGKEDAFLQPFAPAAPQPEPMADAPQPQAQQASAAEAPAEESSFWGSLADSAKATWDDPLGTAADAARGAGQGFSRKWNDEIVSAWLPEAKDDTGIPRTYAEGSAQDAMRAQMQRDNAEAKERSPWAYGTTEIAATLPGTIAMTAAAGPATTAAFEGAITSAGGVDSDDPNERARAALVGGALGYAGGKVADAVPGVARWAGSKLQAGAKRVGDVADELRLRGYGATKPDLERLAAKPGGVARYARGGERLGIGMEGTLPARVRDVADDAGRAQLEAQARKDALAAEFTEQGVTVDPAAMARAVRGLKQGHGQGPAGSRLRSELDAVAGEFKDMDRSYTMRAGIPSSAEVPVETIETSIAPQATLRRGSAGRFERIPDEPLAVDVMGPAPDMPLRIDVERHPPFGAMDLERRDWGKATNFASDTPRQALRKDVYGQINDTMAGAADEAIPGAGQAWRGANEDEHIALEIADMAKSRAAGETTNRLLSPTDYMMGGVGAVSGPFAGLDPVSGFALGAGVNHLVRGREHAAAAGMGRMLERGLGAGARGAERVAGATDQLMQRAPVVSAASGGFAGRQAPAGGSLWEALASSDMNREPVAQAQTPEDQHEQRQRVTEQARGYELEHAVNKMLRENPQALGKFQRELQEAAEGDSATLAARLDLLKSDPEFSKSVLPALQRMTTNRRQ